MKLSNKIIDVCIKFYNQFTKCEGCPVESECKEYRNCNIRFYEEFKQTFNQLDEKVKTL